MGARMERGTTQNTAETHGNRQNDAIMGQDEDTGIRDMTTALNAKSTPMPRCRKTVRTVHYGETREKRRRTRNTRSRSHCPVGEDASESVAVSRSGPAANQSNGQKMRNRGRDVIHLGSGMSERPAIHHRTCLYRPGGWFSGLFIWFGDNTTSAAQDGDCKAARAWVLGGRLLVGKEAVRRLRITTHAGH